MLNNMMRCMKRGATAYAVQVQYIIVNLCSFREWCVRVALLILQLLLARHFVGVIFRRVFGETENLAAFAFSRTPFPGDTT